MQCLQQSFGQIDGPSNPRIAERMKDIGTELRQQAKEASQGDVPEEKFLVAFDEPTPPSLVATSPSQMTLQWKKAQPKTPLDELDAEGLAITYALLMRLVPFKPLMHFKAVI